jgi:hypothetical protein
MKMSQYKQNCNPIFIRAFDKLQATLNWKVKVSFGSKGSSNKFFWFKSEFLVQGSSKVIFILRLLRRGAE